MGGHKMRNRHVLWVLAIALGFNLALGLAALAQNPVAVQMYLPAIFGPVAQAQDTTITTLVDSDSSFVNAAVIPGTARVVLAYIDRAHGNRLHIVEDKGNRVVEIQAPVELLGVLVATDAGNNPAFIFPGPKQADGTIVFAGNKMHIYATSRDEGDPAGPFKLKRLSMPVPAATP